MAQAKKGDTVKVHYTGKLDDGSVFDSSSGREPLLFKLGGGMVIPGFEAGVTGLSVGDKKRVKIKSADAYGPKLKEAVIIIQKGEMPPDIEPVAGMKLQLMAPDGNEVYVEVAEVGETTVTLDGNHPLAGKDLTFDLELVSIE